MKYRLPILACLCVILTVLAVPLVPIGTVSGPVDRVIVIEESGDRTADVANVIGGATARSLRDAGKWRLWDRDSVPDASKDVLTGAESLPWCAIQHGSKTTWSGPLPTPEPAFADRIKQQGGI